MIHSLQKGGNLSLTKTAPDCSEIEVIKKISSLMNNKNEKCQVTPDEIRDAIVMTLLK